MNRAENSPDRPLDVWFICNAWTGGGAERVTSTIVQHLDRDIVQPSVCLLRNDMSYPLPDDVEVHHLEYRGLPTFFPTARRLRRLVNDRQPDVVVSTVNANALLTGATLRRSAHKPPWIARIGSSPHNLDRGLRGLAARRLYRGADRIVVNSKRLAGAVTEAYPFLHRRVATIFNPCDFEAIDRLAADPDRTTDRPAGPLVVAVGRLSRAKRYDIMLKAFSVVRRTAHATLWICGDGPLKAALERQTAQLGLGDCVRWLGFQTNPYALMHQADVFLMTSEFEGLPNSLIEAQGLGVAAVSTDCPTGPDEIIEQGATGILVPVGNFEAVAEAILRLLTNTAERQRMGASARERVRAIFDHRALVDTWHDLLITVSGNDRRFR